MKVEKLLDAIQENPYTGMLVELLAAVPSVIYGLWGLLIFRLYFKDWVGRGLAVCS